jgi:hypothetical protein
VPFLLAFKVDFVIRLGADRAVLRFLLSADGIGENWNHGIVSIELGDGESNYVRKDGIMS